MTVPLEIVSKTPAHAGFNRVPQNLGPSEPLSGCLRDALDSYFLHLGDQQPTNLYEMVLGVVEKPLLESVLDYTKGNQTKAARVLGISRSTLRKKMAALDIL